MAKITVEVTEKALKDSLKVEDCVIEELKTLRRKVYNLEQSNSKLKQKIAMQEKKVKRAEAVIEFSRQIMDECGDFYDE